VSELVGFNVHINILQVISETSLSSQSLALVLTNLTTTYYLKRWSFYPKIKCQLHVPFGIFPPNFKFLWLMF